MVARRRLDPARTQSTQSLLGIVVLRGGRLALVERPTSARFYGAGRRRRLGCAGARIAQLAQDLSARRLCGFRRVVALAKSARRCSGSAPRCRRVVVAPGVAAPHTSGGIGWAPGRRRSGARVQSHRRLSTERQMTANRRKPQPDSWSRLASVISFGVRHGVRSRGRSPQAACPRSPQRPASLRARVARRSMR